ncbi:uncharacterized protein LOC141851443 [Brevipalpus obovatus]|uniref:uncharacterized protein LOC141851443 n=1 Tax=Brevipalpus obovatus TaxID=246614 RepID=UPI003D9E25CC
MLPIKFNLATVVGLMAIIYTIVTLVSGQPAKSVYRVIRPKPKCNMTDGPTTCGAYRYKGPLKMPILYISGTCVCAANEKCVFDHEKLLDNKMYYGCYPPDKIGNRTEFPTDFGGVDVSETSDQYEIVSERSTSVNNPTNDVTTT